MFVIRKDDYYRSSTVAALINLKGFMWLLSFFGGGIRDDNNNNVNREEKEKEESKEGNQVSNWKWIGIS